MKLIERLLLQQLAKVRGGSDAKAQALLSRKQIQVHTVDSFQGSEVDIVILSFVRSNLGKELGFLKDGNFKVVYIFQYFQLNLMTSFVFLGCCNN